jgi:CRP/FNR family cyclic AMP-dependent transcriptional regulator
MSGLHSSTALDGGLQAAMAFQATAALRANPTRFDTGPNADPTARRLFASHPLLTSLPDHGTGLLRWSRLRVLDRQEVICQQGDTASIVVFVLEGHVKLSQALAEGGETILEIVGPGGCLGDMAAVRKRPHDTTATTLSSCRLLLIDARQFRQAFERHPDGLLALLQLADERCQTLSEGLADARGLSAAARLAKMLVRLARLSDSELLGETRLPLQLSQSELGALSGMCREFVCRYLCTWRKAGWIQMLGGAVVSLHVAALAKLSGEDPNDMAETRRLSA